MVDHQQSAAGTSSLDFKELLIERDDDPDLLDEQEHLLRVSHAFDPRHDRVIPTHSRPTNCLVRVWKWRNVPRATLWSLLILVINLWMLDFHIPEGHMIEHEDTKWTPNTSAAVFFTFMGLIQCAPTLVKLFKTFYIMYHDSPDVNWRLTIPALLDVYGGYLLFAAFIYMLFYVWYPVGFWGGWDEDNPGTVWRMFVRFLYSSNLLIGTAGIARYYPKSAGAEMLVCATINSSTLMNLLLLGVATRIIFDVFEETKKHMKLKREATAARRRQEEESRAHTH
eukprot:gnl/Spiro4/22361_TR11013_c0_g1_i1.p1 gnl/Spiro4/22361_TR11013_c0_g1~~gnl/Spiro4/22361_TR11013_c0_g1_i1.p1  ORF type:complete len:281 (-),score=33.66 gnl/Spiro4/22361_TR11013_c0_g1_i1:67-909(-)